MGRDEKNVNQYFSARPDTVSERGRIDTRIHGVDLCFFTDTQVFSKKHIDFGTRLMLDAAIDDLSERGIRRGRLLDLGCGYGAVGITMKRVFPAMDVVMTDINERATVLARENAEQNHSKQIAILESDGVSAVEGNFDVIMTNPPVRAGKQTVFSFYEGAYAHLMKGGTLYAVLQRKQGAPSSKKKLEELFGSCEIIRKDSGYWIMKAVRAGDGKDE